MKKILFAVSMLAAASAFAAPRTVTPDPYCWQIKRHFEKLSVVTNGGAKVVFLGDSITHFWEEKGKGLDVYNEMLKTYDILDLGTSGDRTEHVLWRITEGGELDGYSARLVVLMIGTNNTGRKRHKDSPEDIVLGIKEILKVIRAKQPKAKIVLHPIFPRGANAEDENRVRNEKVNAEIKNFADNADIIWVDFNAKLLDEKGDTKWCMPDRLHPNMAAYRDIWLPAIKPYLDRYGKK